MAGKLGKETERPSVATSGLLIDSVFRSVFCLVIKGLPPQGGLSCLRFCQELKVGIEGDTLARLL